MITIDRVTPEEAERNQETVLMAYAQKMEQAQRVISREDALEVALNISLIASALPDYLYKRIEGNIDAIQQIVAKYTKGRK